MDDKAPWRTDERGIADFRDTLMAWFRDPCRQVLSLVQPIGHGSQLRGGRVDL